MSDPNNDHTANILEDAYWTGWPRNTVESRAVVIEHDWGNGQHVYHFKKGQSMLGWWHTLYHFNREHPPEDRRSRKVDIIENVREDWSETISAISNIEPGFFIAHWYRLKTKFAHREEKYKKTTRLYASHGPYGHMMGYFGQATCVVDYARPTNGTDPAPTIASSDDPRPAPKHQTCVSFHWLRTDFCKC